MLRLYFVYGFELWVFVTWMYRICVTARVWNHQIYWKQSGWPKESVLLVINKNTLVRKRLFLVWVYIKKVSDSMLNLAKSLDPVPLSC